MPSPPASTIPAWGRSTPGSTRRDAPATCSVTDEEAVEAFVTLSRQEGIIPALESAHAVAQAIKTAPTLARDRIVIVNLSGRGDKDAETIAAMREEKG